MKRTMFCILSILLVLMLSACGGNTPPAATSSPQPSATAAPTAAETAEPTVAPATGEFTSDDLLFVVNGQSFALMTDVTPLLKALGDDYEYSEAISCVYEGYDKTYTYGGGDIYIYTNPIEGVDVINEIIVYSDQYPTAKGIAVGASLEDVVAAYGGDYINNNGVVTYIESGDADDLASPRLLLDMNSDQVASIDYYYPTNITEG